MTLLQRRLKWRTTMQSGRSATCRAVVLSTFTVDPVAPYLGTAFEENGIAADVVLGPYGQLHQECLSTEGVLAKARTDVLFVWPRIEDLWLDRPVGVADEARYIEPLLELAPLTASAARRARATLVFALPAIPSERPLGVGDAMTPNGVFAVATRCREALRERLSAERALIVDVEDGIRQLGASQALDARKLVIGHIPYTEALYAFVGDRAARAVRASRGGAARVVVLADDGTLWPGSLGTGGADALDLAEGPHARAFRAFQRHLLDLRRAGVRLALCSRHPEHELLRALARPEMILRAEHLSAWVAAAPSKAPAIEKIARELRVKAEEIVYVDADAAERAAVEHTLPAVRRVAMPEDPASWHEAFSVAPLDHLPWQPVASEATKERAPQRTVPSDEALARLDVTVGFETPSPSDAADVTRVLSEVTQFTVNARAWTEEDVRRVLSERGRRVALVRARDRAGDLGVVGAYVLAIEKESAILEAFVLKKRALGRRIEDAMMAQIFEDAARAGARTVLCVVEDAGRNEPARVFFATLGATPGAAPWPLQSTEWPKLIRRAS